jgi:hypothetical protein
MKTKCCKALFEESPIFWNEFNGVVQCHYCGTIWNPIKLPKPPRQKMLTEDEVREAMKKTDPAVSNWFGDKVISSLFGEESDNR